MTCSLLFRAGKGIKALRFKHPKNSQKMYPFTFLGKYESLLVSQQGLAQSLLRNKTREYVAQVVKKMKNGSVFCLRSKRYLR
jgi:hypothetical protein